MKDEKKLIDLANQWVADLAETHYPEIGLNPSFTGIWLRG